MQPAYWLASHVYLCATEEGTVLLDLRKDKYLALTRAQSDALAGVVVGWPENEERSGEAARGARYSTALAEKLLAAGVLTRDVEHGKSARPIVLAEVEMATGIGYGRDRISIRPGHVARFVYAVVCAALALRFKSLESVVNAVAARRKRAMQSGRSVDLITIETLVNIFSRLRTYTYTRRSRCLFDALALVNFLAAYGQFPAWVIGVRSRPFMAHSWVQEGGWVFDAAPDAICELIPIVAV